MEQLETSNKTDLIDRKKEKELVKPYRKYQLTIFLLIILMITFCSVLYSLNKELNSYIKENNTLSQDLYDENIRSMELDDLYNRVEVNYVSLYELDKELNIDIIRDLNELSMLTNWISTNGTVQFSVCYKASAHGDAPKAFRENCGGISPIVVLIETTDGFRFGGYTNVAFTDEDGYKEDENAFLFSFDTQKKYKVVKTDSAVGDFNKMFPLFGRNDIVISPGFLSEATCATEYPKAYEEDPNAPGDYVLNGGMKKFKIKEMEVMTCYISNE